MTKWLHYCHLSSSNAVRQRVKQCCFQATVNIKMTDRTVWVVICVSRLTSAVQGTIKHNDKAVSTEQPPLEDVSIGENNKRDPGVNAVCLQAAF